ncbi:hypothetical protein [Rhodococcus sp. ZPP]|uniref:hypothetical protein n=1 Tax=Rhodococcus sp. ZPP TaxID=2749906 RepID=UPI001FCD926E|nr:hypothetical protein [Rhodococcus sp. ZPP]
MWGIGFVLLGYLAGNSYAAVADSVGHVTAVIVGILVVTVILVWRIRVHRRARPHEPWEP